MECLLSNIVDNLAEEICRILCKDCDCFFEHESFNKNVINCICICLCNKIYSKKIDEHFKNRFKSKFSVSNDMMFIIMNLWMISKNLMKLPYLKKKNFIVIYLFIVLQIHVTILKK